MRTFSLTVFFVLCIAIIPFAGVAAPVPGSPEWDSGLDGQRAKQHVAVLASDSLRGRYSGFAGAEKADRFLCDYYQSLGLSEPFGSDGFQQPFTYGAGEYLSPTRLVFRFDNGHLDTAWMWQEYNIFKYSGFGEAKGRLVFVGFGIAAPEKGWDDYANLDVKGAVVLALRGGPDLTNVEWDEELLNGHKSTIAHSKGAVAYLVTDEVTPKLATIGEGFYREALPAAWISSAVADSLLKETGKTRIEWKDYLNKTLKPDSRILSMQAELLVSGSYYPERPTCNIVAALPGEDEILRQEAILIGAHMDHHGVDALGNIYPGADDNASGTAAVMELARIFAESPLKHRRTLLFAGFAAEEEGLTGSRHLVKALPIGDYKLIGMINMDMVGQGDGSVGVGGIDEFPRLGDLMFADYPDSTLGKLEFWGLYQGSDHTSFEAVGIPSYVVGARGAHPNYHTPNDTAGAIKAEVLKAVGDMAYHCAAALADDPDPMIGELDQAVWLPWRKGGIEFIDPQAVYKPEFREVKGVERPANLTFLELASKGQHLSLEEIISRLENARTIAE